MRNFLSRKLIFGFGGCLVIFSFLFFYIFNAEAADPDIQEVWTSSGDDQTEVRYGAIASADVNNDGYNDVIVGAAQYDTSESEDAGKVYLYLGSASGLSIVSVWSSSGDNQAGALFGTNVSSAGDVNGDGYEDVIIGAYMYDTVNEDAGKAYLYLGNASGLAAIPGWTSSGDDQELAGYGMVRSAGGDVNGDGYDDVVVGAYNYNFGAGKGYLYLGSSLGLSVIPSWTSSGDDQVNSLFGLKIVFAGDVNNDGYDDVLASAPVYDIDPSVLETYAFGKVYLYLGSVSGLSVVPVWTSSGDSQSESWFGIRISPAEDVNRDGYDDVIISAWFYNSDQEESGKAYVYLGNASGLSATPFWTSIGDNQANARYGHSVNGLDINADGYSDIVVGASRYDTENVDAGKVYLYLGSASGMSSMPFWTSSGDNQLGAEYGRSVFSAGDFNGDGYDDLMVGASKFDTVNVNAGKVYVYSNQTNIFNENIILRSGLEGKKIEGEGLIIYFKKLPDELTKDSNYWMNWKKFNKYPKKWKKKNLAYRQAGKTVLKRYWRLKTNLKKYKPSSKNQKFKIRVAFKYSKKLWKRLRRRNNKKIWKRQLRLKYKTKKGKKWRVIKKHWKKAKVKHKKKTGRFVVKYFRKFKRKKYFFAIGLK